MRNPVQLLVVIPVLLGACTSLQHPVQIDWEHGAKRGTIKQVFDASTPASQLPTCLAMFSTAQIAAHRYVELEYLHRRHNFREVGDLPAGVTAITGDQVEFYPKNCDSGTLSTITRRLPPP